MSLIQSMQTWYRYTRTLPMALQSFTALLGVRPNRHQALAEHLSLRDEVAGRASMPGLHSFRWVLLSPAEQFGNEGLDEPVALILTLAFDGNVDDMLQSLIHEWPAETLRVLQDCEGFNAERDDPVQYLKARQVPCGFMFRDLGPLSKDQESDKTNSLSAGTADVTLAELQSATKVHEAFAEFYRRHPPAKFSY